MLQQPESMPRNELERKLRRSRMLNALLGVIAIAGLVFGGVQWLQSSSSTSGAADKEATQKPAAGKKPEAGKTPSGAAAALERRTKGDPMAIGALDAPVVLSEWTDYTCPFCAVFARDTLPQIVKEYVDSGKVRIEVHDVALFGEGSLRAAIAARAAGEQGKYFEFMHAVYAVAPPSGHPDMPDDKLIAFAKDAGVPDIERFTKALADPALEQAVRQSTEQAKQVGVGGVPFFAADGKALSGAQPIGAFRGFLDQALAAKQ